MDSFFGGAAVALVVVAVFWLGRRLKGPAPAREAHIVSNIEHLRAIGRLSVYRVRIQEIVTRTDHSWGEFGKRYLQWVLSSRKMAMIFEFDIDFVYDLESPDFRIDDAAGAVFRVTMPACGHEVRIRDIRFYDEQAAKFLPWLLPDLVNGFLGDRFSVEAKNRLVESAKRHTEERAVKLIEDVRSDVEASATTTLRSISRAFGANEVEFRFGKRTPTAVDVAVATKLMAS